MVRHVIVCALLSLSFIASASGQPNPPAYRLYGANFSPWVNGQDPNQGATVSEAQLTQRMSMVAPYTQWIRTFGSGAGLEKSGRVAHGLNLKAAIGAWISKDAAANQREIDALVAAARAGEVDLAIVGSEVLLRGDLTEQALLTLIANVKSRIPQGVPVTTADTYVSLLAHPNVIAAVDVVLANYYPYWEGYPVENAVAVLNQWHANVRSAAGSKEVIVSETGWPSGGNAVGSAVPSFQNAAAYFLNFISWARANQVKYFYFEAFDETWKASYEGPQGANWGIWDKNGVLKQGFLPVFQGTTVADNWSLIDGPGTPDILFTFLPPYGSTLQAEGRVSHVNPANYQVAIYINVQGGWWTKPSFAQPVTALTAGGTFQSAIVTGGTDAQATRVAAYLIPKTYAPPVLSGNGSIPTDLVLNSVASADVTRSPAAIWGRVTSSGAGIGGVPIFVQGNPSVLTTTAPSGYYSVPSLLTSLPYVVTPAAPSYSFNPASRTIASLSGVTAADFEATPLPGVPSVPSPANGSAQISTTPVLSWQAIGATSYDVYFGASPSPPFVLNTTGSTYAPGFLSANTVHYWRVVAKNANGSVSSPEWNFRTAVPVAPSGSGLKFVAVTPCRLVDTRPSEGVPEPFGPPALAGAAVRTFVVPDGRCEIPASAKAYSLNVTVVPAQPLSYLTLYPAGQPLPVVSTLNSFDARVVANAAIVPAGTNGAINVYATHATELILDINGYFTQNGTQ
jgi:exo-beta-1,3-glucanase (GH17 family)